MPITSSIPHEAGQAPGQVAPNALQLQNPNPYKVPDALVGLHAMLRHRLGGPYELESVLNNEVYYFKGPSGKVVKVRID